MKELKAQMNHLMQGQTSVQSSVSQSITLSSSNMASLKQNVPNPFSNGTVINFVLPKQCKSAQVSITDMNGQNHTAGKCYRYQHI